MPFCRARSIILLPNMSLLWKLKSASIRRIARSFVTNATPATFSSMTDSPRAHRSGADPVAVMSDSWSAWHWERSSEWAAAL